MARELHQASESPHDPSHLLHRVTRSSTRLTAGSTTPNTTNQPSVAPARPPPSSRKRKAPTSDESSPNLPQEISNLSSSTSRSRTKRTKVEIVEPQDTPASAVPSSRRRKGRAAAAMSNAGTSGGPSEEKTPAQATPASSSANKRKSRKKDNLDTTTPSAPSLTRRTRKSSGKSDEDVTMKDEPEKTHTPSEKPPPPSRPELGDENMGEGGPTGDFSEEDDEDDPFGGGYLGRPGGMSSGLSRAMHALSGILPGMSARFRGILENLRAKDDPSIQLIALQELSELLLVSNEDTLAGHFSPEQYVKELVVLMQPSDYGDENPEIMLLACRCIANLMEALPAATANVVYCGAVPILCQKLLEIHFIDLAEQALSTLQKISVEFPASIVREGGLTACLTYLDFFATSTQRTAVTTAANCCRNIPEDSFPVVRDVMPILLGVLSSSDQKVVEQGCICVASIVDSFRYQDGKLEELVSPDLLRAILRLLLPGTTNLIGSEIHTKFLRVLSIAARASPRLAAELLKMNVVDTLYQMLTGVSPPSNTDDAATKIDSVVIMQALIHRPKEQIFETLNVICELLPSVQRDGLSYLDDIFDAGYPGDDMVSLSTRSKKSPHDKRREMLEECKAEVKRFTIILLPTLTDAYSSTVNLHVRQKVLTAHLKMLSNVDVDILETALTPVPYASFLASILSQQDHATLVTYALQAAELLLKRLESIYRYQFYREGVVAEIRKLAERPCKSLEERPKPPQTQVEVEPVTASSPTSRPPADVLPPQQDAPEVEEGSEDDDDEEGEDEAENEESSNSDSSGPSERDYIGAPSLPNVQDIVTMRAQKFIQVHEEGSSDTMRQKAGRILDDLKQLAEDVRTTYSNPQGDDTTKVWSDLAQYFDGNALESITSYELLRSGVVEAMLDVLSGTGKVEARAAFLEAFMGATTQTKQMTGVRSSPQTPLSVLVKKLQDLLSRAEHFEVITVHQNTYDSSRSSAASLLAKNLRLKLIADEDSGIPRAFRNIQVSIHAIATFKALDDYLRPRISLSERPRSRRDGVSSVMAAYANAVGARGDDSGRLSLPSTPPVPGSHPAEATNRPLEKKLTKTRKHASAKPATEPSSSAAPEKPSTSRRSSRRRKSQNDPLPPPPPPPAFDEEVQDPLECADEAHLSDDDLADEQSALDAIVGEMSDEMEEDVPDPSAVNVEVASTGKVTATKDTGSRVPTPSQSTTALLYSQRLRAARAAAASGTSMAFPPMPGTPGTPGTPTGSAVPRPSSYAAALASVPSNWHLAFTVNDQPISSETTIYRAVHFNQASPDDISARNVWAAVHTIKIKRVSGPPPAETSLTPTPEPQTLAASGIPQSLDKNPTTSIILRLLYILHDLNSNLDDVLSENKETIKLNAEPLAQFVNTKLTAKLNRQLEEPLIVASNCLPSWAEDLARFYPFLFPFETRHLFLQSTSFGYSRSMTRWQNAQSSSDSRHDRHRDDRPFLGRLQRQKVRISRTRILESAIKVMELYGSSPSILEVEYFEEVGTGLGPTLEFYSTVSKEFSKKKLKLWRENESNDTDEFAFGKQGLFPSPMSEEQADSENGKRVIHLFKMLGKFVARSMLDSRIIDISFNPIFFRIGDGNSAVAPSLGAVKVVDSDLARALKLLKQFANSKRKIDENPKMTAAQKVEAIQAIEIDSAHVEDLGLDFTLPGYSFELKPDGANIPVTIDNVAEYVQLVLEATLGSGVQKQVDAFRQGFSLVFPYSALKAFTPDELVMLFGRVEEDWTLETLMDSIKADHGYNLDSKSVRNLLQTMSELTPQQRRDFLQFVTGSPKLPIGGFKSLTPMFTVVCKPSEPPFTSDDYLPSVMTCVNYLKMPDYSDLAVMKKKLEMAIMEGQGAFHLS